MDASQTTLAKTTELLTEVSRVLTRIANHQGGGQRPQMLAANAQELLNEARFLLLVAKKQEPTNG